MAMSSPDLVLALTLPEVTHHGDQAARVGAGFGLAGNGIRRLIQRLIQRRVVAWAVGGFVLALTLLVGGEGGEAVRHHPFRAVYGIPRGL